MRTEHDRAFKEWAISCAAMQSGEQILLIRKGGIREDEGTFAIADTEFFLMPTHEHQDARLLQTEWVSRLHALQAEPHDAERVTIAAYAVVDTVLQARDDAQVNALAADYIWNAAYVKQRFDFNPYDPLYLLVLRIYNLPHPITLDMQVAYVGCKSWVTLDRPIATQDATPALSDEEFARRRAELLTKIEENGSGG